MLKETFSSIVILLSRLNITAFLYLHTFHFSKTRYFLLSNPIYSELIKKIASNLVSELHWKIPKENFFSYIHIYVFVVLSIDRPNSFHPLKLRHPKLIKLFLEYSSQANPTISRSDIRSHLKKLHGICHDEIGVSRSLKGKVNKVQKT